MTTLQHIPFLAPGVQFLFLCIEAYWCGCIALHRTESFISSMAPYLSVVGQVVGTVHELLQGASGPVGALVAGGQLLGRRGSSVAHVEGGFPRGSSLHVPPLAEVSRHRVPQQSDVVELPVGRRKK